MSYNVDFDICALIILIITFVYYLCKKNVSILQNNIFILFVLNSIVTVILDIATTYIITYHSYFSPIMSKTFNELYFLFQNTLPFLFAIYCIALTKSTLKLRRFFCFILYTPITLSYLILFTNPIHENVFKIDSLGNYSHGKLFLLLFFIALYYFALGSIYFSMHRSFVPRSTSITVYCFVIVILSCLFIQFFYPTLLLQMFGCSLCLLLLLLTIQNPDELYNSTTRLINRSAFSTIISLKLKNQINFTAISIMVEEYPFYTSTFGIDFVRQLSKDIAKYFISIHKEVDSYYIHRGQFCLVLKNPNYDSEKQLLKDLIQKFKAPWIINDIELIIPVRFCVIRCPEDAQNITDFNDLVEFSFTDFSEAKSYDILYANKINKDFRKRESTIKMCLKNALLNKQFEVYYQPIFSTKEKTFKSAEALIRLRDEQLGFISPEEFIPIAEQNGMILDIGLFVFENVCQFISSNDIESLGIDYIEINLSVIQCMQNNLSNQLRTIMEQYNIKPSQINLEVTETAAANSPEMLSKNMKRIDKYGISFSLDDYGTGYSNMTSMLELPFKLIKLDKSIIWSAFENPKAYIAMANTISMIQQLDLEIVAEGIETQKQASKLSSLGCDYLQGYYYSKPIPGKDLIAFLKK